MFRAEKKHIKSNSLILEKIILVKISVQINSNRYIYSMLFYCIGKIEDFCYTTRLSYLRLYGLQSNPVHVAKPLFLCVKT